MTIKWLEEMKRYGLSCYQRNERHKALQADPDVLQACIPPTQLLALIRIAEAAQEMPIPERGREHDLYEAVEAAERCE